MTHAHAQCVPAPSRPRASWLATLIGRATLRFSRYPARRMIGRVLCRCLDLPDAHGFTVTTGPCSPSEAAPPRFDGTEGRTSGGMNPGDAGGGGTSGQSKADPITLDALHLPAVGPVQGPPIVMVHGWLEVKEIHGASAMRLARAGHDVILFDHRSHGRSTGRWATFGVQERHDLAAVIDAAAAQGIITDRVITLGFSLGAATVLQHAPMDRRVQGVVAVAPFVDFRTAINSFRERLADWIDRDWLLAGFERATTEAGFTLDQACTRTAIGEVAAPVLIVEGGADRVLPPSDHIRPLIRAKTRGSVEVVKVPGARI